MPAFSAISIIVTVSECVRVCVHFGKTGMIRGLIATDDASQTVRKGKVSAGGESARKKRTFAIGLPVPLATADCCCSKWNVSFPVYDDGHSTGKRESFRELR